MARKKKADCKAIKHCVDKQIDKKLKKLSEPKYHLHGTAGATAINPTFALPATINPLVLMAQGNGPADRVGNVITPTSLQFRMTAYRGATDCTIRVIFFRFKELGYARLGTAILDDTDDGTANIVNAPYVLEKASRKRFQILYDKRWLLDDAKQNGIVVYDNVKMSQNISYDGGTSGANQQNGIYYMVISDCSLLNAPDVRFTMLTRYRDF